MKKALTVFGGLFLLLCFNKSKAQFIIAGQHAASDYYHSINNDTTLNSAAYLNVPPYKEAPVSFTLDLNGDSSPDFIITGDCNCGALGQTSSYFNIITLNKSNNMAFSQIDSCKVSNTNSPMIFSFNRNDTIKNLGAWKWKDTLTINYSYWNMTWGSCYEYISDTSYIGFRLIGKSDTLYGWLYITLNENEYSIITLYNYACNKEITGISENNYKNSISVYPNPSSTFLTVQTSFTQVHSVQIILLNLLGQTVICSNPPASLSYSIDVGDLPKAAYIVQVQDILTGKIGRQRVVVQ